MNFGVTVISRIEGGHSTLKRFLNDSKNDLFGVIDACSDLHVIQYRNLKHSLTMQRDRVPTDVNAKYKAWLNPSINSKITPKALRELIKQHKYSQDGRETTCTGAFERSIGIPCRHTLQSLINLSIKVKEEHFHVFWRFKRPPAEDRDGIPFLRPPALPPDLEWREPAVVVTRGRPRRVDNSTRRDASSWELALGPSTRGRAVLPPSSIVRSSAVSVLIPYTLYANGIRHRILPYLKSLRLSLLAMMNSIFQSIQSSLASI